MAAKNLEAHVDRAITRANKIEKKQLQADEEALEPEIDEAARAKEDRTSLRRWGSDAVTLTAMSVRDGVR